MFPCLCINDETLLELASLHKTTLVICRPERVLSDEILDEFMHASCAQDMCLMLAVWRLTQLGLADVKVSKDPRCRELLQHRWASHHTQFWYCLLETQRVRLASGTRVVSVAHAFFGGVAGHVTSVGFLGVTPPRRHGCANLPRLIATVVCTRNCQRRFSAGLLQLFV